MNKNFSDSFFVGNRQRLRQLIAGEAPIVVTANGLLQKASDNTFQFYQDSNFWYLTGLNDPDVILVIEPSDEYLIVPGRSAVREAFDGVLESAVLTAVSGIHTVLDDTDGWKRLDASLAHAKQVATVAAPPSYIEQAGMYTNPARVRLQGRLESSQPDLEIVDIREQLTSLRMIKQPAELAALQSAIDITIDSLQTLFAPDLLVSYQNEYELEADLTREFRHRGAAGHAFSPIIAGGKRACTLHNVANEAPLGAGELLVLDVGAEVDHYAADITRTISRTPPTPHQQEVYDAVLAVQSYALTLIKPGMLLKEYEAQVEVRMGEELQKLGLIETADHDTIRHYYPHATSHFLGLDVHDVGDYLSPLPAGVVITCEPGIYIPEEGIGIRIEDDVLLTEAGNKVLSERLTRDLYS